MMMRTTFAVALLIGCVEQPGRPVLRIEPAKLDVDAELGIPRRAEVKVFADDVEVTPDTAFVLEGAPLGSVDSHGFTASASRGGVATIAATFDGQTIRSFVHVSIHSRRYVRDVPTDVAEWFRQGTETIVDNALEPGDGAVLPPNLGKLDIHFAADDFEDVHEITLVAPDVDVRIYSFSSPGARMIPLTVDEWYAIAQTGLGGTVDLAVRSTRIIDRSNIHTLAAKLRISELPIASTLMFTGRATTTEMPQMWSYSAEEARTATWMPDLPAGACLGCHVTVSRDGRRVAAGGNNGGTIGSGVVLDSWTHTYTAPPSAAIGNWIAAAYDPAGNLLTTTQGKLTIRDGTTALPIADLPTELPAGQPAVSNDGAYIAYVGGPIDPVSTNPINDELRIHTWSMGTQQIGPSRTLIQPVAGETLKLPEFSPDDKWIVYSKVRAGAVSIFARPTDGRFLPVELVRSADLARFASKMETVRAGDAAEPMAWLVMKRFVAVGPRNQDRVAQLWATAFLPDRGFASRPIHLPGQRADVAVLHAPSAIR